MRSSTWITALASCLATVKAQNVTVPNTCTSGYMAGRDEVIITLPYTYNQVMSIIGSYQNLTWSGNPVDTVKLNGTDNTVGTARSYSTAGANVIETLLYYSKPASPGPYVEIHNVALLTVPSYNVSAYFPYDGTVVSSVCNGRASQFNFTATFCATNATLFGAILHALHTNDAVTAGTFLGGKNFTTCDALTGNATSTSSGPAATYTGAAVVYGPSVSLAVLLTGVLALLSSI